MSWVLYGANGYTGQLVAALAAQRGEKPVLAGRSADKVRPLAERLGLPWRAAALDDAPALDEALRGARAVLHCAGPFSATSAPMIDACLRAGAHYLDVTGEIEVFEAAFARDAEARQRGVGVLPGVGFDVVPTDCLALTLSQALPGARELQLAFATPGGRSSAGTLKSSLEALPRGGRVRRSGKIVSVPLAHEVRQIQFGDRARRAASVPWGDVSTAYRSTGIPDITVFMAMPRSLIALARLSRFLAPALRREGILRALQRRVGRSVEGPSEEQRRRGRTELWGRATDGSRSVEASMQTPDGYAFTAESALESVKRAAAGALQPGAWTPAQAFGPGFATTLPGVSLTMR
jgi:saccharopine dehydrogenase (NAD+, L-lysine-forming)